MEDETYEFWDFMDLLKQQFPRMYGLQVPCPAPGEPLYRSREDLPGGVCSTFEQRSAYIDTVPWIIAHLNDSHHWSRGEIADWLDLISDEYELDLSLPLPTDIPPEPGEEAVNNREDGA